MLNGPGTGGGSDQLESKVGDCAVYEDCRRRPGRVPLEDAARSAEETEGFVWIGLQQPNAEEIARLAQAFGLPGLAVEDAVKAHQRPKLELYEDVVFVVLKPVRYIDSVEIVEVGEISLFIGPKFVVTVRHGQSDVLRSVRSTLDQGTELMKLGPTAVLYLAFDAVVDGYEETIAMIDDDVDEIEIQVFGADEVNHAERIYKLKREIAAFRRAVIPLTAPLRQLVEGTVSGIAADSGNLFRDVQDHLLRTVDSIESQDRLLSDVLQADLARLSVRQSEISVQQNEDMRKISAWAAIALVPTAVAGIYGMNFKNMPELNSHYGYFVVLALILGVCLSLYRLFRRKGWL